MKKYILLACLISLVSSYSYSQDATAPINSQWRKIAGDTTLT